MTASRLLQVNPKFIQTIEDAGMKFVGRSTDGERMEIMELEGRTTMGYIQHQILICTATFQILHFVVKFRKLQEV